MLTAQEIFVEKQIHGNQAHANTQRWATMRNDSSYVNVEDSAASACTLRWSCNI